MRIYRISVKCRSRSFAFRLLLGTESGNNLFNAKTQGVKLCRRVLMYKCKKVMQGSVGLFAKKG